MEVIHGHFKDKALYDSASKTAISVRDGFLEYAGAEIGKEPSEKIFKIYRSPATIANVAGLMAGISLTDEHVDLDVPVSENKGKVKNASMIDLKDESTHSRLAIKNMIDVSDDAKDLLQSGKRELSLGYKADLVPYDGDEYDFEQKNISPHHLAIVDQGRCGSICSFIDKKPKEIIMNKRQKEFLDAIKNSTKLDVSFIDAEGAPNMQEIVDMTIALPDAIKSMPIDKLKKIAAQMQAILASTGVSEKDVEEEADETEATDMEGEEQEAADMDKEEMKAEDEYKDEGEKVDVKDSAEFKDALAKAVEESVKSHTAVIEKAREFVDAKYSFEGKDTNQIMRDALAVEHGKQKFEDAELPVAFKLLKQSTGKYKNFADDKGKTKFEELKNKEL